MSDWIESENGAQINAQNVEYFETVEEYDYDANTMKGKKTGRFYIRARVSSTGLVVRTYDTEEEAKTGLRELVERLTGTNQQQGTTVINVPRGAAFPGADTARLVDQVRRASEWRAANGFM